MNSGKYVFSQLVDFLKMTSFKKSVTVCRRLSSVQVCMRCHRAPCWGDDSHWRRFPQLSHWNECATGGDTRSVTEEIVFPSSGPIVSCRTSP